MMTGGVIDVFFFTHWEINSGMAIQRRLKEFYYEISWKSQHKIDLKIFVRKTMGVGKYWSHSIYETLSEGLDGASRTLIDFIISESKVTELLYVWEIYFKQFWFTNEKIGVGGMKNKSCHNFCYYLLEWTQIISLVIFGI